MNQANRRSLAMARGIVSDLVVDIRFADRKIREGVNAAEERAYRETCVGQLRELFAHRHRVRFNRYGWPMLPAFQPSRSDRCKIHASEFAGNGSDSGFAGHESTGREER